MTQCFRRYFFYFLVATLNLQLCKTHFNLYLKHAEVKRILGLTAELFYVREGVVNDYALGWTVPVPAHVHTLFFTWQALIRKPVLYNMGIWTNTSNSPKSVLPLFEPSLNISHTGNIPEMPETFQLKLPCTGFVNSEVDVILNINVTSPRPSIPPTVLYFRRRKICLKGESSEVYEPHQDPKNTLKDDKELPGIYFIVSGIAGGTLVILIVLGVAIYRRRMMGNKNKIKLAYEGGASVSIISTKERLHTTSSSFLGSSTPNNNMYTLPSSVTVNSYASLQKTPTNAAYFTPTMSVYSCNNNSPVNTYTYAHPMEPGEEGTESPSSIADSSSNLNMDADSLEDDAPPNKGDKNSPTTMESSHQGEKNHTWDKLNNLRGESSSRKNTFSRKEILVDPSSVDFRERFKMMQIERQRIRITAVVKEGKFGRVYRGWIQGDKKKLDQQVVIKTLKEGVPMEEERNLCREGARLFNFLHKNILSLHGVSFADQVPTFLIYADHGSTNLKLYLQSHKEKPLKASEIVDLGLQTASGLTYLHAANVLHADIAARNCVVDDHLRLRLTDASLAPDLFPSDYESGVVDPKPRPLKWIAYEVITDRLVSTASDVWSYGVLLWELSTQGGQPYEEVNAKDMADYLREGYRLVQPHNCPDDLYKLMAFCWAVHPYDRPRAERILAYMTDFEHKLKCFV